MTQLVFIDLCTNVTVNFIYLRMRGYVTFLTDGSIMTKVNTIQTCSTLDSTHTQLLVKPVSIHITATHYFQKLSVF